MEYDRHTPEQLNLIEKEFITETLFIARQDLIARQGISEYVSGPINASKYWFDKSKNTGHSYLFVTSCDQITTGRAYHLSYTEDNVSQFMYLDKQMQNNIIVQLLAKSTQAESDAGVNAKHYLASIRRLDALSIGDPSTARPSDLQSLIRYTQRVQTQYESNDIDCMITKKIVMQELLDDQVLSEVVCGAHAGDDTMDVSFEDEGGLFYSLDTDLACSDVAQDLPEMRHILRTLNFTSRE